MQGRPLGVRKKAKVRRAVLTVLALLCAGGVAAQAVTAAPPTVTGVSASGVSSSSATLKAEVNPGGKLTRWHFEYGLSDCSKSTCTAIPIPEGQIPAGSSAVPIEEAIAGLIPGTVYHFLLSVKNGDGGTIRSVDRVFATRGASGPVLPDSRAFEQASPIDKDGGDADGEAGLVKAASVGGGVSFGSTFGMPGGKGAQAFPSYFGLRESVQRGWATRGLLPPPVFGERARVQGWLADFGKTYANAERLGSPRTKALIEQDTAGASPQAITAYVPDAEYAYDGTSKDASTVVFESEARLPAEEGGEPNQAAIEGRPNVYVWDRSTHEVSLAGVMNDGTAPAKGTLAGPYNWVKGAAPSTLRDGGSMRGYYLQGTHAITASGDIYFTESGTGQLYLRRNPTQPQSEVVANKCTKLAEACTIHVSASKRTTPDPAGPQPAAFQAASADGSKVFFTSPEKLTDNANTGPEQPAAGIGIGSSATGEIEDATFIPKRAVGVAVDSKYVYWADPIGGTIGRAELNGDNPEDDFIAPGPSECEFDVEIEPGVFEKEKVLAPTSPRYVAVDAGHIYWTNTGLRSGSGDPLNEGGTIGRADIEGAEASVEPSFICGASNPQGVAVNSTHVFWANAATNSIARATADGNAIEQSFFKLQATAWTPYGVAVSADYVYYGVTESQTDNGILGRISLVGGEPQVIAIGSAGLRGVSADTGYIYWTSPGEAAVGRIPLSDYGKGNCGAVASCEREFVKDIGGKPNGLASDSSHLYWSVNGESPSNPGNDLYRYEPSTDMLTDLTPDSDDKNGAEVQGVLGVSEDGSRIYFAANGDLDGGGSAGQGNCKGPVSAASGSCSIYLWDEGSITSVGAVRASGGGAGAGSLNWTGTPRELFSTAGYTPKTAFVSKDGQTLLFQSQEKLSDYDNEGVPEFYRFHVGDARLRCVSCPPSGEGVGKGPRLESVSYPGPITPALGPVAMVQSRNLSTDGNRAFFETAEALVPEDINGEDECPAQGLHGTPACQDLYEWEAPGTGSCSQGGPGYSVLNEGCIYLISTGKSPFPSYFADASETGDDVFFFTRESLVGQDQDELQDVYDARVGGGLASQNPLPPNPCPSAEACHGPAQAPPAEPSPGSASFLGPGNPVTKHPKQAKKHKHKKHHKAKKKHK